MADTVFSYLQTIKTFIKNLFCFTLVPYTDVKSLKNYISNTPHALDFGTMDNTVAVLAINNEHFGKVPETYKVLIPLHEGKIMKEDGIEIHNIYFEIWKLNEVQKRGKSKKK